MVILTFIAKPRYHYLLLRPVGIALGILSNSGTLNPGFSIKKALILYARANQLGLTPFLAPKGQGAAFRFSRIVSKDPCDFFDLISLVEAKEKFERQR